MRPDEEHHPGKAFSDSSEGFALIRADDSVRYLDSLFGTVGVNEDPGIAIPCDPDWVVRVVLKHQAERPAHPRLSEFLLLPKGDVSIHLHRAQVAEASFSLGDTKHRLARATEDSHKDGGLSDRTRSVCPHCVCLCRTDPDGSPA